MRVGEKSWAERSAGIESQLPKPKRSWTNTICYHRLRETLH
jgi:hypothetical protein